MVGPAANDLQLRLLLEDCLAPTTDARPSAGEVADRLRGLAPVPIRDHSTPIRHHSAVRVATPHEPTKELVPVTQARPRGVLVPIPARPPGEASRPRRGTRRTAAIVAVAAGAVIAVGSASVLARGDDTTANDTTPPAGASARPGSNLATGTTDTPVPSSGGSPLAPVDAPPAVASATTFAHDWFGALNTAVTTGDATRLTTMSSPGCQACQQAASVVTAAYASGGSFRGGTYVVRAVDVDNFFTADLASVHVVFDRTPRSAVSPSGDIV